MELVRATIGSLGYKEMMAQLRKLEDIVVVKTESGMKVKEDLEDTLYGRDIGYKNRTRGRGRARSFMWGSTRGRGSGDNSRRNYSGNRNPADGSGRTTKCFICKSVYHWARDCPNQSESNQAQMDAEYEEVHVTLFTKGLESECQSHLLGDTIGCAVLDSGCSRNVCSDKWLHCYIESLSDAQRQQLTYEHSDRKFRFGDNRVLTSMTKATIPANIGNNEVMFETDVISNEIPLLLSKEAMKKANTVIDFQNDKVTMFGKQIDLLFASSGHYVIPLNKKSCIAHQGAESQPTKVYFNNTQKIKSANAKEKETMCMKIHRQFSHANGSKLKDLLKDAGITDQFLQIMHTIHEKCNICIKYKKPPSKPIVYTPLAKEFNESVAMDLKDIQGNLVLHLIDHATRFSAACTIPSKRRDIIISAVLKIWIAIFGAPRKILSDNGGEFANDDFREMGEKLNTRITNTAAESPWSNGINERHNAILGSMVVKVMEDTKCKISDAVAWAVSAKNSLSNVYGYSPNQLVFGKNPNFPSVLHDKLPAVSGELKSEILLDNLNALHSARKAFIAAESDERIRRALRQKTRNFTSSVFQNGDSVYYKRDGVPAWKGPGVVIGSKGQTVLVKHGSVYVRVHPSRLVREYSEFETDADVKVPMVSTGKKTDLPDFEDLNQREAFLDDKQIINETEEKVVEPCVMHNQEITNQSDIQRGNTDAETGAQAAQEITCMQSGNTLPKIRQHVSARMKNEEWKEYEVISRAGRYEVKCA